MKKTILMLLSLFILYSCAPPEKKVFETVFYPALPQQPRLQFLTSITTEEDIGKKQSAFREFLLGEIPPLKRIERPYDIGAVKGKIYISDRTHKRILIINLEEKTFDAIQSKKAGAISEPAGIWVTGDDYKYVTDFKRKQVLVYDDKNRYVRAYGKKGQFSRPLDVAIYQDKIYVCDFDTNQIIVVDKNSGETINTIGTTGKNEGELFKPTHLIVDNKGNIYVNDSFNFRIQKFSPEGKFLKKFGYHGDTLGGFARPKGLAIDREEHLYVVDTAFENVQIFDDRTTELLLFFGGFGPDPGDMYLPNGIFIDYENVDYFKKYVDKDFRLKYLVYVGNMLGRKKLNVYGFGEWIGEPLPEM
jgi:DNA-binding beta-propeller fold protein YncE